MADRSYSFALPPAVCEVMAALRGAGYEVFLVGGCVRDLLRGVSPSDYDMTTSATPDEMHRVFRDYRTVDTGIRHGTVTVLAGGSSFEITTYRVDGEYADSRHPDAVCYTASLREDAARRDFTVNAIAYHPEEGLCDYFDGRADIEARLLRAVGDPERRFREDALRILRALRFSSTLGFSIEEKTAAAARKVAPLLLRVSAERVREEMTKLLLGDNAPAVLAEFSDIFATLFPNWYRALTAKATPKEALGELGAWLSLAPRVPAARYTVFFSVFASGEEVAFAMDALRFDHRTRDRVVKLLSHRNDPCTSDTRVARRFLSGLGGEDALLLLDIRRAACLAAGEDGEAVTRASDAVRALLAAEGACTSVSDLSISGKDLLAVGFSAGREMGLALKALFAAVADGQVQNEKNALLSYAERHLQK